MNNTAPISLGICVVAALFGLVGGTMLFVMWDYTFMGAAFMGGIIAVIVAIILWLGWRPANDTARDMSAEAHRAGQAPTVPAAGRGVSSGTVSSGAGFAGSASSGAAGAASAATTAAASTTTQASAPATTSAPAATTAPASAPAASSVPESGSATSAASAVAKVAAEEDSAVKSSLLPGETELSERKGEWKYDGGAADTSAGGTASASTPAASGEDYDGDGVVEGTGEGSKPATLSAARDGGPDNLKEIKGVGPKMEQLLHSMGFFHFDQVAAWTADEVAWVDANLEGFKGRVSRDTWVEQAKILAAGGETEFSKKVDKGGVY